MMISASSKKHKPTRRAMSRVLRAASWVLLPSTSRAALPRPATPMSMVRMAAKNVPTNTYANGWMNMTVTVGRLVYGGNMAGVAMGIGGGCA